MIQSADGGIGGVLVRVTSKKGCIKLLCRPIQHIYPLEIHCSPPSVSPEADNIPPADNDKKDPDGKEHAVPDATIARPVHRAATQGHDQIIGCLI